MRTWWACLFAVLLLFGGDGALAQCAMCKSAVEASDNAALAEALRQGIGLLLAAPYLVLATLGFIYWRKHRNKT